VSLIRSIDQAIPIFLCSGAATKADKRAALSAELKVISSSRSAVTNSPPPKEKTVETSRSPESIYRKARLREVPCVKVGRALRFDVKALEQFIEKHAIEAID
jgi:hypothetical protein